MKYFLAMILALAILLGLFFLGKYVLWPERLSRSLPKNINVDLSLEGITLSQGQGGVKLWQLEALSANYAEANDQLLLDAPQITYWGNDTTPIHVQAPHGQVWHKKDQAKLWGGVQVQRENYQLKSQSLDYLGTQRTLTLVDNVHLQGPDLEAESEIMVYYLESGEVHATGHVQVLFN